MPIARFQLPDGRVARFEVPEGTSPEQAQSMIQSQLPAISQPAAPGLPESLRPRTAASEGSPGARQDLTTTQRVYQAVRPYAAPVVEALGAGGGALLGGGAGTVLGPVGTATGAVGGAGLGYGIAKEALELADVYLGGKAPRQGAAHVIEPVRNILEGATFEAGGRVVGPLLQKGLGKLADLRQMPQNKAASIARNALGPDLPEAINALKASQGTGVSAAQATADINSPTWQALIARTTARDPRFLRALEESQGEVSLNALVKLAGGATATEARTTNQVAKQTLNDITSPARQASLSRANKGMDVAALENQAAQDAAAAAQKVQQVRTLESGKNKAIDAYYKYGIDDTTGTIIPGQQANHMGSLAQDAERWASKAADASLNLGQGSRYSQAAADTLRAAGVKPLETQPLVDSLHKITRDPEFAGNDVMRASVDNLTRDLIEWTGKGGVIDARALDAIRKNSVNAAVRDLLKGQDPGVQREAAASVMARVKPMIVDAVEAAGGKGYRSYLEDYAKGMQDIAKQKLSGKALDLWKNDKDAFVRLVKGESPETVEKILGPGKYNIAVELAENTLDTLHSEAAKVLRNATIKSQVEGGQTALKELLLQHMSKFRFPSYMSALITATNKSLNILENKIGRKTMGTLTEALKTPEGAANLLESLPAAERTRVLRLIGDPSKWSAPARATVTGTTAAGVNMLAPDRNVENEFVR